VKPRGTKEKYGVLSIFLILFSIYIKITLNNLKNTAMKLNQTTYRLYLRTGINQTGYTNITPTFFLDAALAALVANVIPVTPNPIDAQD
jgi:hypothetical protein